MEAKLKNSLVELKSRIEHLSVSDRWTLLKWLVEVLHQEPQRLPEKEDSINLSQVEKICAQIRNLPVLDHRTPDEIIGYDEFGGLGL